MKTTKLGDIKIEALKLMFADYKNDYSIDGLSSLLSNDNYGKYLRAMNGSINRCFDRLRALKKQPKKTITLDKGVMIDDAYLFFDMTSATFANVDHIWRISFRDSDGIPSSTSIEYELEGSELIIENMDGTFKMIYFEKLPYITDLEDSEVLEIDDELARLLPYFIKSELMEEDEPELARQARVIFEQSLASLYEEPEIRQTKVVNVLL